MSEGLAAFGSSFLSAFTRAKNQSRQNDLEERQKSLLIELAELNLEDARTRQAAFDRVSQALSPTIRSSQDLDTLMSGGTLQPKQPELLDLMVSGMLPQFAQMEQFGARRNLAEGMRNAQGSPAEFFNTPEGASLALEGGISPVQFFGQQASREPTSFAVADALAGPDRNSQAWKDTLRQLETQDQSVIDALQARVELQQERIALQQQMRDLEARDRGEVNAVFDVVEASKTIADSLDTLEGTFLEPGAPMAQGRYALLSGASFMSQLTGMGDPTAMNRTLSAYGDFSKATSDLVNQMTTRMAQYGTITDTARQSIQSSLANAGLNPEANRNVLVRVLNDALRDAERLEFSPQDIAQIESVIERVDEAGYIHVNTVEEAQALEPGTVFIDPSGTKRVR